MKQAGYQEMPTKLEKIYESISAENAKKSFYSLYLWQAPEWQISKPDFVSWLGRLVSWYSKYTGAQMVDQDKSSKKLTSTLEPE